MRPSTNKKELVAIDIPATGQLVNPGNLVIIAKLSQKGVEEDVDAADFTISAQPQWFQPEMLKSLVKGRLESYRVVSAQAFSDRLILQIGSRSTDNHTTADDDSELVIAPTTRNETLFMLALYLVDVFECYAYVKLCWRLNPASQQNEFVIVQSDVQQLPTVVEQPPTATWRRPDIIKRSTVKSAAVTPLPKKQPSIKSGDQYQATIRELESRGWIANGRAQKECCTLIDCAHYIDVLSSTIDKPSQLRKCITYLHRQYGIASGTKIQNFLGDTPGEWIRNSREWLKG